MHQSPSSAGGPYRRPLCGTPVPGHSQVIVLVVIILLAVTVGIAAPTPAAAASTAALVQAGAALWIALRRSGASTADS
jgi:hypothetical protein